MPETTQTPDPRESADEAFTREASHESEKPKPGNVLTLDLESQPGGSAIHQQVFDLEQLLEKLVARQESADNGLRDLRGQTDKVQGDMNLHLDLTNRKLQAVLERYTGLKSEAELLGRNSARLEQELTAARIETESLLGDLEASTFARIEDAKQATRDLLRNEAEQADSASGRLAVLHPLGNFGSDSVVRGERWLAGLDKSQYMVRLLRTRDKTAMYKVADRWAYYLKGRDLAYRERPSQDAPVFELLYGPFELATDAERFATSVPSPDSQNRMQVVSVQQLQAE